MVDELPDPGASLDADKAGDPGPDAPEAESAPGVASESEQERAAREYEQALAPYLEKRVSPLSEYVTRKASEWAFLGRSVGEPNAAAELVAEATDDRERDMWLNRDYAEQGYRQAQLEVAALEVLSQESKGGEQR